MEQQVCPVLVVSHVSVMQVLMAYFRRTPVEECTSIEVPMNTVIQFAPVTGGGWVESQHVILIDEEAMDSSSEDSDDEQSNIDGSGPSSPSVLQQNISRPPIWGDHNALNASNHSRK